MIVFWLFCGVILAFNVWARVRHPDVKLPHRLAQPLERAQDEPAARTLSEEEAEDVSAQAEPELSIRP